MGLAFELGLVVAVAVLSANAQLFPDCVNGPLSNTTVCDVGASPLARGQALASLMTVAEKISVSGGYDAVSVPRLGLPNYWWWNEALHGVASSPGVMFSGAGPFNCATSFPEPILMSAAFDDALIHSVAGVIGKEARAFNNYANNVSHHAGLDFWTPNINPFRDPRWGRGQETPGEDPTRTAAYIKQLIPGLQGGLNPKYPMVAATCKHYAGYDMEDSDDQTRYGFDAVISTQDLSEYYMPPFQSCVRDSNVLGVMCSYNAVNGVPSCADPYLLQTVLRDFWGFPDSAHWVTSDCDAIGNIYTDHHYALTPQNASALSLKAGTDYDCGSTYPESLQLAYDQNLVNMTDLDLATARRYSLLAKLGYFDPANIQPHRQLGWSDVNTLSAQKLAYTAAAEGITLLKNDGTLPLKVSAKKPLKIAVIDGCWANATTQMQGNYQGTAPYLISPIAALRAVPGAQITYAAGITGSCAADTMGDMSAVEDAAADADVIVYLGGIDVSVEAEGQDRTSISWPANQISIINQLATYEKPTVIFQMGGGQIDSTFIKKNKNLNSLIWGGLPGQSGGQALIDVLIGKIAPAGRLVASMYPANYVNEVLMINIGLRPNASSDPTYNNPGRTYMWYNKTVYPFGYGKHYTSFAATDLAIAGPNIDIPFSTSGLVAACRNSGSKYLDLCPFRVATVNIRNTGGMASDYSVLAFLSGQYGPAPYPSSRLATYTRLFNIGVGKTKQASLELTLGMLSRTDNSGRKVLYPGTYHLSIDTTPALTSITFTLTGPSIILEDWPTPPPTVPQPPAPVLSLKPLPSGYTELGCYHENDSGPRYLPYEVYANSSNTPQLCAVACTQAGYNVSGAEYGSQCYCGTQIPPFPDNATACNMPCTGDPYQPCGGTWHMEVAYQN